jgi:mono/diheme cytochrome c family protein
MVTCAMTRLCTLLLAGFAATPAFSADANNGKQLAAMRCMPCHGNPGQFTDVAKATPFDVVAQKFAPTPEALAFWILEPHPRMNLAISRRDAEDIAAYNNGQKR